MKAKNFTQIKEVVDKLNIDVSDDMIDRLIETVFKTEATQSNHDLQQWVYVDLHSDFVKKTDLDEEIDWEDLKYWLKGDHGKFFFLKVYHPEVNGYHCDVNEFFKDISDLQKIDGIYSYDFVSIKDVIVLDHIDGTELPFMRLLYSVETPKNASIDQVGIAIGDKKISPLDNKFILFDASTQHEAWNHTNSWWKFFIIDISLSHILDDTKHDL
jgi:hypothetical protein